jgi:hypothetical protein
LRWYKVKKPAHLQSILLMHVQIQMSLRVQTNTELTAVAFQSEKSGSRKTCIQKQAGRQNERGDTSRSVLNMWEWCLKPQMQCGTPSSSTIEGLAGNPSRI